MQRTASRPHPALVPFLGQIQKARVGTLDFALFKLNGRRGKYKTIFVDRINAWIGGNDVCVIIRNKYIFWHAKLCVIPEVNNRLTYTIIL